jgi:hypothetical protein
MSATLQSATIHQACAPHGPLARTASSSLLSPASMQTSLYCRQIWSTASLSGLRPALPSCRQPMACPTLRSGQPTGWPERPDSNLRTGIATGGRPRCRRSIYGAKPGESAAIGTCPVHLVAIDSAAALAAPGLVGRSYCRQFVGLRSRRQPRRLDDLARCRSSLARRHHRLCPGGAALPPREHGGR